jgi:hypothetical protein
VRRASAQWLRLTTPSLTHLLTYLLTHSLTHLLTHSLTHYAARVPHEEEGAALYARALHCDSRAEQRQLQDAEGRRGDDLPRQVVSATHSLTHSLTHCFTSSLCYF